MINDDLDRCIIAYFDLIGYKNYLKVHGYNDLHLKIMSIYEIINELCRNIIKLNIRNHVVEVEVKKIMFSDNILMYIVDNDEDYTALKCNILTHICAFFQFNCLMNCGFLMRGSIVRGSYDTKNDFVFGEGFIDAYEYEQNAIWPRIILDESVVQFISSESGYLLKGDDEKYIDYLSTMIEFEKDYKRILKDHKNMIYLRAKEAFRISEVFGEYFKKYKSILKVQEKIRTEFTLGMYQNESYLAKKYVMLAKYHNSVCKTYDCIDEMISGPLFIPEIVDISISFYSSLEDTNLGNIDETRGKFDKYINKYSEIVNQLIDSINLENMS